jgi:polar amino acid transport system substrate-binding protein
MATSWRLYFCTIVLALVVLQSGAIANENVPFFRHVDTGAAISAEAITREIKLLTDEDFAPFSFKKNDGTIVGVSVELATAACALLHMKCVIVAKSFNELLPALERGEGDAIISGLRTSKAIMQKTTLTRPYFFSLGQFVARMGMPFETPDTRTLAGRRVGFVKGTSHQAFLEKYFDRAALTPFETEAAMFESLRTGGLDVVFTDSLHAQFWLRGSVSRGCCMALGAGFIDRETFSRGLSFLVRRDQDVLRENFDSALDHLQTNGTSSKIFSHYFPDFVF